MKAWRNDLQRTSEDFQLILNLLIDADKRGNELIDIADCKQYEKPYDLIKSFRYYGLLMDYRE